MTTPQFSTISLDIKDGIATLWLDRPEKMNAFTPQMKDEMIAAFDHTDANDDVRAVIVTGRGRAFCAGADLSSGGDTFDYDKRQGEDHKRDGGGQVSSPPHRAQICEAALSAIFARAQTSRELSPPPHRRSRRS